jgi:FkbM family methyltransferase
LSYAPDIRSINHVLARLQGEFNVPIDYERLLETQYSRLLEPDNVVFDVGAHEGRHTTVFARLCPQGRVEAFEPIPALAAQLQKLGLANVRLHQLALSTQKGQASFTWARGTPGESGLRQRMFNYPHAADPVEIKVEVDTLDSVAADAARLDYIKLDIEGGEIDCMKGGEKTIRRHRPVISVEYGFPSYSAYNYTKFTLWDLAQDWGYALTDIFGNHVATREDWDAAVDVSYWDYFMVPAERLTQVQQKLNVR